MKNNLLYAIILLSIIFLLIYISKKVLLEGFNYTYNKDLAFNSVPLPLVSKLNLNNNDVHLSTCKLSCDTIEDCTGFTSNIINDPNSDPIGSCNLYSNSNTNLANVSGTNLYLKIK